MAQPVRVGEDDRLAANRLETLEASPQRTGLGQADDERLGTFLVARQGDRLAVIDQHRSILVTKDVQSAVAQDVPPFMLVDGNPLAVRGFNVIGLRRRGFSPERIAAVKQMHKLLYREGRTLEDARAAIAALAQWFAERQLRAFVSVSDEANVATAFVVVERVSEP